MGATTVRPFWSEYLGKVPASAIAFLIGEVLDCKHKLVTVRDRDDRFLYVNETWERRMRKHGRDAVGHTIEALFPGGRLELNEGQWRRVFDEGKVGPWHEKVTVAGETWVLESTAYPLLDEHGEVFAVCLVTEDQTVIDALQQTLHLKMISNIGEVLVIIDSEGVNRYKSPNLEKNFGWLPEELVGRSAWEIIHPDDLQAVQRFFFGLLEKPRASGVTQTRYRCKDGSYKWIAFKGVNMSDDPEIDGVLGHYHDISEWKAAEKSLKESEERFKALHNASFGGIAIHDKGIILDCNLGLTNISGYSQEELLGMDGLLLLSEGCRDEVMANILRGYEKPYEVIGLRKDGSEYPLRLEARNIPYRGKQLRVVEFRDITEARVAQQQRKALEEQLLQAQKMESIGRLAGGVAHDFNNMLGVIVGYTDLALDEVPSDTALHNHLKAVLDAAERSMQITRQLLAFARRQPTAPTLLNLNETVGSMLKMLQRLIGEQILLEWAPGEMLRPVKMDPSQLDQILANLCVNSRDAIAEVGWVRISTADIELREPIAVDAEIVPAGEYIQLTFSDSGSGMTEEVRSSLFEPFFTTKSKHKGTGLGMSTVYGIVKQNRGYITVRSSPGVGTIFDIYLPAVQASAADAEANKGTGSVDRMNTETILLVEDEPAMLSVARTMLTELGYTVLPAAAPGEALDIAFADNAKFDLLLTDVIMPEMSGREMALKIVSRHTGLKVLYMSGYTADEIDRHGVLEEEIHFIQKPFSRQNLARKVAEILDGDT